MKKKLIAAMMILTMAFSLAACGTADTSGDGSSQSSDEAGDEADQNSDEEGKEADSSDEEGGETGDSSESDMAYVKEKGTLVVGITDFAPMDYQDENGQWVGFDADMARAFAESLGVEAEFIPIQWGNKIFELDGRTIDCAWNGMTLTDEVLSAMECSNAYCNNAQIVIVPVDVADQYQDVESLADLNFAVEDGSAGKAAAEENDLSFTPVLDQATALMEVASGTCDAAIIDSLMAAAMVGEGTSYENLTYTVSLTTEEYGVGFRKGSDLAAALNDFFVQSYEDGTMQACAEKYGVQAALIEQ